MIRSSFGCEESTPPDHYGSRRVLSDLYFSARSIDALPGDQSVERMSSSIILVKDHGKVSLDEIRKIARVH